MSFATHVSPVKQWPGLFALAMAVIPVAAGGQGAAQTLPLTARTKGSPTAPVTVYEMADFQCPVCGRFVSEIWPAIEKEYIATGKVRWIYIMFPLTQIHANAAAAAEFATCAALEGKFWPAHVRVSPRSIRAPSSSGEGATSCGRTASGPNRRPAPTSS